MSFMTLPREIRNQIYVLVIHLERDAPRPPLDGRIMTNYYANQMERLLHHGYMRPSDIVHCENEPFPLPYTSLLCANRQIRAEIHEALAVLSKSGNLTYKIDIMVDKWDVYATWLSVPAPTKHLAELRVDFRRVGDSSSARWVGPGGPGATIKTLSALLSRFIAHGPAFFGEADAAVAETQFKLLTLRVIDTDFMDLEEEDGKSSLVDFDSLNRCAAMLRRYDILGRKTKLVRTQWRDRYMEHEIPETKPSDEHLALCKQYGWYRGVSPGDCKWKRSEDIVSKTGMTS